MQVTDKLIEFHEMTGIFPMMDNEALDKLADDILINGLLEPIIMFDGKIVDGRNRYMACLDAEVAPEFVEWDGEKANWWTILYLRIYIVGILPQVRKQWRRLKPKTYTRS